MKKILLSTLITFIISLSVNAQSLPLNDNFESYDVGYDVTNEAFYEIAKAENAIVTAQTGDSDGQFVTMNPTDPPQNGATFKVKGGAAFGGLGNGSYLFSAYVKSGSGEKVKTTIYGDDTYVTVIQEGFDSCLNWTTLTTKFTVSGLGEDEHTYPQFVIRTQNPQQVYFDNLHIADETTGVIFNEDFSFTVAPNPSNGQFSIRSEKAITEYSVVNTAGQIIENASNLDTKNVNIDLSNRAKGVYLVKIKDADGHVKVVKQIIR